MTFIDVDTPNPSIGAIITFSIFSLISLFCAHKSFILGKTKSHYRQIAFVRYLFPVSCVIIALENSVLASTAKVKNLSGFLVTVFLLQAFVAPILLVATFEITYVVHKRRSVNFCGIYFDRGQRVNFLHAGFLSFLLRNLMRFGFVVLLLIGLVANFDLSNDNDELAGRAGWSAFWKDDRPFGEKNHWFLSLLPTTVLSACCFYWSVCLWKYGNDSAMVVHSSICNSWFVPFFGTLSLFCGQFFGEQWYRIACNAGYIIFFMSLILLMNEVDKDMESSERFSDFLSEVERVGNRISVKQVMPREMIERELDEIPDTDDTSSAGIQIHSDRKGENSIDPYRL